MDTRTSEVSHPELLAALRRRYASGDGVGGPKLAPSSTGHIRRHQEQIAREAALPPVDTKVRRRQG